MKDLHGITGVPSCFFALDGKQLASTGGQYACMSSCRLRPDGISPGCCDSETLARLKCGESGMVRCPGGFELIVAPVCLENRKVAFFLEGPLHCPDRKNMHELNTCARPVPGEVPQVSRENGARHLALASTFAGMLSMCITHSFQLIREIEGRKLAEDSLHRSEALYRTIFEHSGTAMAIVRTDSVIVQANLEFGNLLGIDQDVLPGTVWTLFVSSGEREKIMEAHEKRDPDLLFSMNGSEISLSRIDGRKVAAVLHTGKIPGSDRYVLSLLDITERQRLEEMREEAFAQIDRNFTQLAVLNDRIRNPLTAIVGLAGMSEGPFSKEILKHAMEIDDLVTNLDKCWLESEAVRRFLRKHYGAEEEEPVSAASKDTKRDL